MPGENDFLSNAISDFYGNVETPKAETENIIDDQNPNPDLGTGDAPADTEKPGETESNISPVVVPPVTEPPATPATSDFFQEHFAALNFKDVNEVKEAVQAIPQLTEENEQLKEQVQKLSATPHFTDENDKRVYDWVKQYKTLDERAFLEHKMVDKLNPETIEGKQAMELDFILSKKNLSHEDARKLFNMDYKKRFETDELATDDEVEMARISRQEAEYSARENLKALKSKYGTVEKQPESAEQKAMAIALERSLGDTITSWDKDLSDTKEFTLKHGASEYRVEVSEAEKKVVNQVIRPILENKANYDQSGRLKFNVNYLIQREMKLVLFDKLLQKFETDVTNKASEEAFKTITSRQADKRENGSEPLPGKSHLDDLASSIMKRL